MGLALEFLMQCFRCTERALSLLNDRVSDLFGLQDGVSEHISEVARLPGGLVASFSTSGSSAALLSFAIILIRFLISLRGGSILGGSGWLGILGLAGSALVRPWCAYLLEVATLGGDRSDGLLGLLLIGRSRLSCCVVFHICNMIFLSNSLLTNLWTIVLI